MGVDYIVALECDAKMAFGDRGEELAGTGKLVDMLKARDRAELIGDLARRENKDVATFAIDTLVLGPDGVTKKRTVTRQDLLDEAAPLEAHAAACSGCKANFGAKPFGCVGYLAYPVPAQAEEWLMARLEPSDSLGGKLLLDGLKAFGLDGAPVAQMRKRADIFEARRPVVREMGKGLIFARKVDSNQVLQALLQVGPALDPWHCMGVLVWLGALLVDGTKPATEVELKRILTFKTREMRRERTALEVGATAKGAATTIAATSDGAETPDAGVESMQLLLRAVYTTFVEGVPLLVSP